MKSIFKLMFSCCSDSPEKEHSEPAILVQASLPDEVSIIPPKATQDITSNKKSDGEGDITLIKPEKLHLKALRPSIILSMDGSEHQVVLFEDKVMLKPKRGKKRRAKRKHSKPVCNK